MKKKRKRKEWGLLKDYYNLKSMSHVCVPTMSGVQEKELQEILGVRVQ
jgi:hypothetical protein